MIVAYDANMQNMQNNMQKYATWQLEHKFLYAAAATGKICTAQFADDPTMTSDGLARGSYGWQWGAEKVE